MGRDRAKRRREKGGGQGEGEESGPKKEGWVAEIKEMEDTSQQRPDPWQEQRWAWGLIHRFIINLWDGLAQDGKRLAGDGREARVK